MNKKPVEQPLPWGRDGLMATAAVRYCLGRMTYIVSDCADWLIENWDKFPPNTRTIIQRDIEEAIINDDEARSSNHQYKPLGWDCDRERWLQVRKLWKK